MEKNGQVSGIADPENAGWTDSSGGIGIGQSLRSVREKKNLTLREVAAETRIREEYLKAIEEENTRLLPPAVYVLGYVRNLCRFYGIDEKTSGVFLEELKKRIEYETPDLPKVIRDSEPSPENQRLMRRIVIFGGIGLAVLVITVTLLIVLIVNSLSGDGGPWRTKAGAELELLKMTPSPRLEDAVLPEKHPRVQ